MPSNSLISVVEAAYSLDIDDSEWLKNLCQASQPVFDGELGVLALLYDATKEDWVDIVGMNSEGVRFEVFGAMFNVPDIPETERRHMVNVFRSRQLGSLHETMYKSNPHITGHVAASLSALGLPDADFMGIIAADPSHRGCLLGSFSAHRLEMHHRAKSKWARAAAHIATGWRMRQRLRALETKVLTESAEAEAILSPDRRTVHALEAAKGADTRERLRGAVIALERARRLARNDPDEALIIWEALVEGRWSLLDSFDRDGRRYWVAHRNEPKVPEVSTLTDRERQVAAYAALGQSNKLIAYELGISLSQVARHLRSARAKLGATSRVSLLRSLSAVDLGEPES